MPSRQLGQNFLIDPNMARWIVSQLEIEPGDAVVEVGPGTGALSSHLAGKVRKLVLIEFDARLAAALREKYQGDATVEVFHEDGAKFDRRKLFKYGPLKFLGNLPYSSGGAILKNLLESPQPFVRAVVMLQKEVIDRLAAQPGTKDYGLLSLRTQADWVVTPLRTVPPEAFHPRPAIDSTVAVLTPREDLPPFDHRLFDELIRRGFAQRRKQLKKQMPEGADWPTLARTLDLAETSRGEELSLRQWVDLARLCDENPLKDLPQKPDEVFDVVDKQDIVQRQASRDDVHKLKLCHRAVHGFVFDKKGNLLLQRRSRLKDMNPGLWDSSVAGHLNAGENYADAILRELEEEMGIIPEDKPRRLLKIHACEETNWEFVELYEVKYEGGKVRFPAAEVEGALWFPVSEVNAWVAANPADFANGFLRCWMEWKLKQNAI